MSIVRMKRLRLLALEKDRDSLLENLQKLGCVQIDGQPSRLDDPEWASMLRPAETGLADAKSRVALLTQALDTLSRYAKVKSSFISSLFTPRPQMSMELLTEEGFLREMTATAEEINAQFRNITALTAERGRLENRVTTLSPWQDMDVPLDTAGWPWLRVVFGVCPVTADMDSLKRTMEEQAEACEVFVVGSDSDYFYLELLLHPSAEDDAGVILKSFGFSRMVFKDVTGTAAENIAGLKRRMSEIDAGRDAAIEGLSDFGARRDDLRQALDAASVRAQREEAAGRLLSTGQVVFMEGWTPESAIPALEKFLGSYECAFEAESPADDDVPVLLRSGPLTQPFRMVTEMYSLPRYSNIDPNPLISVFYAVFFGMMFGDVGYGLVLFILGMLVTRKGRPGGMMGNAFRLMSICGVTTMIAGVLMGGYFSNAIEAVRLTFFGLPEKTAFEALLSRLQVLDPLGDPLLVLGVALGLGVVQILFGMGVKMYLLIRDGHPVAACLEILPWWFLFASIGVFAADMLGLIAFPHGAAMMIAGFVLIVLTQGYAKKGIFKKLAGGLAALYNITAYLSDILSYSRIMALGLAGGVIGMVFNTLASMPGGISFMPLGIVLFLAIFLAGHVFNLGVSLIGTYVHAARLQYVEFFSKFYDAGGSPFAPLMPKTKYTEIVSAVPAAKSAPK